MYELTPHFDAEVDPGTNILLTGPPLSGKRSIMMDVLAAGTDRDEGAIVVTTKDGADRVLRDYEERTPYEGKPVAVVDCVTRQQGGETRESDRIKYASSPVDMTGIGIKLSEFLQAFGDRGIDQNRVMVHSLSTLLMYSDLQTVFRFLHVFTGRVQSVDGLGLYSIDSTAHDDQAMNTLKQLFDGIVTVPEDGDPEIRLP
ncbi:recombinase RecA [Halorubrum ezzemoulense]|jgi:KaiC/GvpD/RAD55 family RecA-like ATPase|uniref:Recombinase RecA n=1 Tax=Halorubrum ezzemoulense TaxID=337243 RepID=A0A256K274_HALEZ|nr:MULTISPECIES: recombinase RecA [Halorubrum]MDB2225413.1 recombinase RecA [Halorubrum ezzemoulense]MDB2237033.1 recombinase RecA [Halorubrum ezzemoulense]MDB2241551.1 recombinase RecA [Halorubrum ezzemoulense]MDB2245629.1 recombinase RecA [Halorubrum ezzemoulense]MDB2246978.1 recombinase RecA [Halorubrum ezzemoulense]